MHIIIEIPARKQALFWSCVKVAKDDECWEWMGTKYKSGYGRMSIHATSLYAHRISYFLCNGPIPEGLEVCHHCDNPGCVNPKHLFAATHKENVQDMIAKNRNKQLCKALHPPKPPRPKRKPDGCAKKLTIEKVLEIRAKFKPGSAEELAKAYGVCKTTIWDIVSRRWWREI